MELSAAAGRVLGALVEKERTTPQGYPLTDNALLAACNQTTSRDPVVSYDVPTVRMAVRELRELGLLRTVHRTGERSDKHRHELATALGLSPAQTALMALLLLRGPQTPAELRARGERLHPFSSPEEVDAELAALAARADPLVAPLERKPGRKETRYAQLLSAPVPAHEPTPVPLVRDVPELAQAPSRTPPEVPSVAALAADLADLRAEVADLRERVRRLSTGAGGEDT